MILADRYTTIIGVLAFLWFMGVFDRDDDGETTVKEAKVTIEQTAKKVEVKLKEAVEKFGQTAERIERKQAGAVEKFEQNEQELQTQELITYEEWERRQNKEIIQ